MSTTGTEPLPPEPEGEAKGVVRITRGKAKPGQLPVWLEPGNPNHNRDKPPDTPAEKLKRRARHYVSQAKVLRALKDVIVSKTAKDRDKIEAARLLMERAYGAIGKTELEDTPQSLELVIRRE